MEWALLVLWAWLLTSLLWVVLLAGLIRSLRQAF
jgi:hypothetical protein